MSWLLDRTHYDIFLFLKFSVKLLLSIRTSWDSKADEFTRCKTSCLYLSLCDLSQQNSQFFSFIHFFLSVETNFVIVFFSQNSRHTEEIWARPLSDGSVAVVLFSRRSDEPAVIEASFNMVSNRVICVTCKLSSQSCNKKFNQLLKFSLGSHTLMHGRKSSFQFYGVVLSATSIKQLQLSLQQLIKFHPNLHYSISTRGCNFQSSQQEMFFSFLPSPPSPRLGCHPTQPKCVTFLNKRTLVHLLATSVLK